MIKDLKGPFSLGIVIQVSNHKIYNYLNDEKTKR